MAGLPGTNIYSILFYASTCIVLVIGIRYMVNMWQNFFVSYTASDNDKPVSWIPPVIKSILTVVAIVVAFNLGWNILQSVTTHSSDYKNPSEATEKMEVQKSKLPTDESLDVIKLEQKRRSEIKPHEDALNSFDESMKKEAEKIQNRSMGN